MKTLSGLIALALIGSPALSQTVQPSPNGQPFEFELVGVESSLYLVEKRSGCVWRKGANGDWLFEGPNAATRRSVCDIIIEKAPRLANQNA